MCINTTVSPLKIACIWWKTLMGEKSHLQIFTLLIFLRQRSHCDMLHCTQGISERLSRTEEDCNVGWLTANQRPIKDTLNTLVSKWKAVYAGYLERQVERGVREGAIQSKGKIYREHQQILS